MLEPRPKLKKQSLDIFLEILGAIAIVISFALPALYYQDLPENLPRHYGLDGVPDAYGGKGIIWVLPIMGLPLYLIISLISTIPSLINLPFKPSPEKIEIYQRKYSRMIRIMNVGMVCTFAFLTYNSIQIGLGNQTQLAQYFMPISLFFFFGVPTTLILSDLLKTKK